MVGEEIPEMFLLERDTRTRKERQQSSLVLVRMRLIRHRAEIEARLISWAFLFVFGINSLSKV